MNQTLLILMKKISTLDSPVMINNITRNTRENNNTKWIIDSGCPKKIINIEKINKWYIYNK